MQTAIWWKLHHDTAKISKPERVLGKSKTELWVMKMKLKRLNQCEKCPWKVTTNPHEIPNGYSVDLHKRLSNTIANPGSLHSTGIAMACHEHTPDEGVHCVGWLMNQLGSGNNIALRMQMRSCDNIRLVKLDGEQHETFADTLP